MPRWALISIVAVTAAVVALAAIKGKGPAQPFFHATLWACYDKNELKADDRARIVKAANDLLAAFKRRDADGVIQNAHPLFVQTTDRTALADAVENSAEQLATAQLPLDPIDIKLITGDLVRGMRVNCYAHEPDGLVYAAGAAGSEPRALVTFRREAKPLTFSFHVELWKHDGRWLLIFLHYELAAHGARNSGYYLEAGDDAVAKGDRFAAMILYSVANDLATISSNILTHDQSLLAPKQTPMLQNNELNNAVHHWKVAGRTYDVRMIRGLPEDHDDKLFLLNIGYEGKPADDATALFDWLKTTHPMLTKHFDGVVFRNKDGERRLMRF